jgi:hypothetical protein
MKDCQELYQQDAFGFYSFKGAQELPVLKEKHWTTCPEG